MKAIVLVADPFAKFDVPLREVLDAHFRRYGNPDFSEHKFEREWRKVGGIRKGKWVDPITYTPNNLPLWCYG